MAEEQLRAAALEYHEFPTSGKISVMPTKALANQRDLSLAYSPGVAYACTAIQQNPHEAVVARECGLHRVGMLLPQCCAVLDVREQEGHGARGKA